MTTIQTPITADDQCSGEELLLRQVLRFGDVVDMLRRVPLPKNFLEVKDNVVVNPVSEPKEGEGSTKRFCDHSTGFSARKRILGFKLDGAAP